MHGIDSHKLPGTRVVSDRDECILSYCRDKNVLNLGCVGSVESIKKGTSLHLKIARVAKRAFGVDTSNEGLECLKEQNLPDLICQDVEAIGGLELPVSLDIIVAGEVLEHLSNPGLCLQGASALMEPGETVLIITVPNAFSYRSFLSVLLSNSELVRSDHNFYFSYITIKSLLNGCDIEVVDVFPYSNLRLEMSLLKKICKTILNNTFLRYAPFISEGLIIVAVRRQSG